MAAPSGFSQSQDTASSPRPWPPCAPAIARWTMVPFFGSGFEWPQKSTPLTSP
jgi:hypothetical protein